MRVTLVVCGNVPVVSLWFPRGPSSMDAQAAAVYLRYAWYRVHRRLTEASVTNVTRRWICILAEIDNGLSEAW